MDKVRLGRALGYGTRHAAKTLAAVAEAATSPDPKAQTASRGVPDLGHNRPARSLNMTADPGQKSENGAFRRAPRVPSVAQVRGAGRSLWGPLATFSGALWLRVTGLFFAVIALAMGNGAWRIHNVLHDGTSNPVELRHFWIFAGFALLFSYFTITSFVRASRRERQRT